MPSTSLYLPDSLLETVDKRRGYESRSSFVSRMVAKALVNDDLGPEEEADEDDE